MAACMQHPELDTLRCEEYAYVHAAELPFHAQSLSAPAPVPLQAAVGRRQSYQARSQRPWPAAKPATGAALAAATAAVQDLREAWKLRSAPQRQVYSGASAY